MPQELRILVVDDNDANRRLVCRFLATLGHAATPAADGAEAIERCREALPDLVLMDIVMPVMDGYAAAAEIRALCGERWLPIIFLSARGSEMDQVEGLAIGDDYLPKPVNLVMLEARIKVMSRIAVMQQHLAENAERLEAYRQNNEREQRFTRHILDHMTGYRDSRTDPVKRWIKPARNLSGDVIAHGYSPTGALHLLIADSTGHGLAAAISAVPAVDIFSAMTRRGHNIDSIAREMNTRLHRLLPVDRFVSAALLSIDPAHEVVQVWNGGIPEIVFLGDSGRIVRRWRSRHPPLGVLTDADFDFGLDIHRWQERGEVFVCSDGLIDAENNFGERFGSERLIATLTEPGGDSAFDAVVDALERHIGSQDNHDDMSLVAAACNSLLHQPGAGGSSDGIETLSFLTGDWTLRLRFSAAELKRQSPLSVVTQWLNQIGLDAVRFGELLLILTELCNNALDHGVLRLDSTLKRHDDGFAAYYCERQARLDQLDNGFIEVSFEPLSGNDGPSLRLRVRDSGPGFDSAAVMKATTEDAKRAHGHGISLVRRLARALRYEADGREAVVDYAL